jgi:hypothetical protein
MAVSDALPSPGIDYGNGMAFLMINAWILCRSKNGHCEEWTVLKGEMMSFILMVYIRYGARVGGPKYYAVNLILRLFLYRFLHTLSSKSIHNNTNTQRTSPPWWWSRLPLQGHGFDNSMPPEGQAALHIYCPRLLLKDLNRFIKLN